MAYFSAAATYFLSCLESATRDDGSTYIRKTTDAPDWISETIYDAHNGELPNDARYSLIRDAIAAIADQCYETAGDAENDVSTLSDDLTPIYTTDLLQWFAGNNTRLEDCDEAMETYDIKPESTSHLLSAGYQLAAENVLNIIIEAIEDNRDSIFNPDTDCRLLISDNQGVYIPQLYCQQLTEDDAAEMGVQWSDVVCCQSGLEQDWYWESWQAILDSAEWDEDGETWRLYQSGDLWQIRTGVQLPEDF